MLAAIVAMAAWAATSKPASIHPESQRPEQSINHQAQANQSNAVPRFTATPPEVANATTEDGHAAKEKDEKREGRVIPALEAAGVVVTGIFTVVLALATIKLWNSTNRLAQGAEDASQRQMRASVGLLSIDLEMPNLHNAAYVIPIPPPPGHIFEDFILTAVKNYGLTPAFRVSSTVNWQPAKPFGSRLPPDFKYPDHGTSPANPQFGSRGVVDPQATYLGTIIVDKLDPFRAAEAKAISLFFYGHIDYTDIYKVSWRRDFCYRWEPWMPKGRQLIPYHEHNDEYRV